MHTLRSLVRRGSWRRAQPNRIRLWLLRLPAKLTEHARKAYLQLLTEDLARPIILAALRRLRDGLPPPVPAQV